MDFLRRLFSGGAPPGDKSARWFYIRPTGCQEVVRVRIDLNNDLSLDDEGSGYFVIKTVRGSTYRCTRSAELRLAFDQNRRLTGSEVTGGALVNEADYAAWTANPE